MQTVALTWQQAGELAGVLGVVGIGLAAPHDRRVRAVGAFLREAAIVAGLYALWQLAGSLASTSPQGAFTRAHWIERFDEGLPLPSERTLQSWVLGHGWIVQAANLYYDSMHLTIMGVFLVWLFVRHRDRYRPVRRTLALATLICLLVQLVPVAPPRMLPGFVDTAMRYGQSVYANGLPIDQLSAMPSVHVAWASLVGWYVWRVSPSRWRFVGPLHTLVTVFCVVVTANHWWLDGIVAALIVVVSAWIVIGVDALVARVWQRIRPTRPAAADKPVAALVDD